MKSLIKQGSIHSRKPRKFVLLNKEITMIVDLNSATFPPLFQKNPDLRRSMRQIHSGPMNTSSKRQMKNQ